MLHFHTHRHAYPPMYTLDMYYIQKDVWVCTDSLAINTIAKCNSPINMKTYPNAQIIILQHYTYVNPLTIIQWTYVGGTEIYILGLARPPNSTQTLINCILLHKSRQQIRGWIYNTLTLYLRKSTYNPHGHKGAG